MGFGYRNQVYLPNCADTLLAVCSISAGVKLMDFYFIGFLFGVSENGDPGNGSGFDRDCAVGGVFFFADFYLHCFFFKLINLI